MTLHYFGNKNRPTRHRVGQQASSSYSPNTVLSTSSATSEVSYLIALVALWTHDIRARQRAGRDAITWRLSLLGWTQEAIGERTGLSQNRVSEIIENYDFVEIDNAAKEKGITETAQFFNIEDDECQKQLSVIGLVTSVRGRGVAAMQ